jgi:O-antigen/teichoic acid export membrane protein
LLKKISKISYKFSTNTIYVLFSIIADQLLTSDEFGKFSVFLALQVLLYNLSDVFNFKYLIGVFSKQQSKKNFQNIFSFKLIWGGVIVGLFSCIYFFYDLSWDIILVLFLINYIQLLSSTMATYIFSNEKNVKLLFSNIFGFIVCSIYIYIYYFYNKQFTYEVLFLSILIYRLVEAVYLYFTLNSSFEIIFNGINKQNIKDSFTFYVQLVLSIGSAKLFMLFLPTVLSYNNISIVATYEYIVAIPLFFISVLTMSAYSQLFHHEQEIISDISIYKKIMFSYYIKALMILSVFMVLQIIYIYYYKQALMDYIGFIIFHDFALIFTSIQGYTLFFWKMNKLVIYLSIFTLIAKNALIFLLSTKLGLIGFFIASVLLEILVLLFIHLRILQKIKDLNKGSL